MVVITSSRLTWQAPFGKEAFTGGLYSRHNQVEGISKSIAKSISIRPDRSKLDWSAKGILISDDCSPFTD